jgi:energy-coupling factor transporter ATP-binding protein EcfA2
MPSVSSIPIYFGQDSNKEIQDQTPFGTSVIILNPEPSWKIGHRFSLAVVGPTGIMVSDLPILLAYHEMPQKDGSQKSLRDYWLHSPSNAIAKQINESPKPYIEARNPNAFFTIIPNMDGYRTLVRSLGPAEARRILSAVNDMVTVGSNAKVPKWYAEVSTSSFFNTVLLRDSETFFTFHNASPILRGLEFEELDKISSVFKLGFKLATFENSHELDLSFEIAKPLGNRIAVVIGKNGVGKSQTLFHFAKSLIGGSRILTDGAGKRPQVNRLIAVTSPGDTRNTFPTVRSVSRIDYRRLHLSRSQWGKAESGIGSTLIQLARSDEGIKGRNRWKMFVESISAIQRPDELFVKRRASSAKDRRQKRTRDPFPITAMLNGTEDECLERWSDVCPRSDVCRFVNGSEIPLSSGQVTFIRFAAQACLHIENGSVLLFDEPETHLHPNLITEFVRLLDRLLEMTGSVAIVATHSAYFVREVPRRQVIVLRQTDADTNKIEAIQPRLRTLGADIGEISHFVFGDELFGRLLGKVREKIVMNQAKAAKLLSSIEEDLSVEAWMNLNRLVPKEDKK